jgi:hypothetical protein
MELWMLVIAAALSVPEWPGMILGYPNLEKTKTSMTSLSKLAAIL